MQSETPSGLEQAHFESQRVVMWAQQGPTRLKTLQSKLPELATKIEKSKGPNGLRVKESKDSILNNNQNFL